MLKRLRFDLQPFLGVAQQEALLEIGHRLALLQPVIGGKDRSARYAGDEVDAVKQRCRAASAYLRLVEAGQHAVGERRRARAATRERQRDDRVVVIGLDVAAEFGANLLGAGSERLVDRLVVDDLGTGDQQGGTRNDTPCAD